MIRQVFNASKTGDAYESRILTTVCRESGSLDNVFDWVGANRKGKSVGPLPAHTVPLR